MLGDAVPWIGHVAIEAVGMQTVDNAPGGTAQRDNFLPGEGADRSGRRKLARKSYLSRAARLT